MPYIRVPKLSGSHPLVLEDAVQVRLHWSLNGVACVNVLGGKVAGGYVNSQTHASNLWTAVKTAFTSSGVKARIPTSSNLAGLDIRDIRVANQVAYEDFTSPVAGTSTSDSLPNQLAAVITLRTALAGKSYRGRIYFGGFDEDQSTSIGTINGTLNTDLVTFVTAIQSAMASEGITLAVLSQKRYANLVPPADVETWPGANNAVVAGGIMARDDQWDTQRRRKS